jgi:hypothetical protein
MWLWAVCRTTGITTEVVGDWIVKVAAHINEVTICLEKGMHLTQCQIDALWSYI